MEADTFGIIDLIEPIGFEPILMQYNCKLPQRVTAKVGPRSVTPYYFLTVLRAFRATATNHSLTPRVNKIVTILYIFKKLKNGGF